MSRRARVEPSLETSALETMFRCVFVASPIGVALVSAEGRFIRVNPVMCAMLGYGEDELLELDFASVTHPDDIGRELRFIAEMLAGRRTSYQLDKRCLRADGTAVPTRLTVTLATGEEGEVLGVLGFLEDVSDRQAVQEALRESEERYRAVLDSVQEVVFQTDAEWRWQLLNPAWEAVSGRTVASSLGERALDFIHPDDRAPILQALQRVVDGEAPDCSVEGRFVRLDGEVRWFGATARPTQVDDPGGAWTGVLRDITERKESERALTHQALHDPLTGLPNRALLLDRLVHALSRSRRDRTNVAVLFVDLDDFKAVNDTLGHDAGDRLLVAVAERLVGVLRGSETIARYGGDEFVVVGEHVDGADAAVAIAERVAESLRAAFPVAGHEHRLGASIGVAVASPDDERDASALIRDADLAMYRAKARGRSRVEIFDEELRAPTPPLPQG